LTSFANCFKSMASTSICACRTAACRERPRPARLSSSKAERTPKLVAKKPIRAVRSNSHPEKDWVQLTTSTS
jgi:hypothetical protein